MKCAICNRRLTKAEFFIGGYPVGSTCAKNRGLGSKKGTCKKYLHVRSDQPDLFEGANDDKEKSSNS